MTDHDETLPRYEDRHAGPAEGAPVRYATAGDLFGLTPDDLDGEDFTLSSGLTVRIRPISRKANLELGKGEASVPLMEARLLHAGLVTPSMSVDALLKWQEKTSSRVVGELSDQIRLISGMSDRADKSSV